MQPSTEQRGLVDAVTKYCRRECGARDERLLHTDGGAEAHNSDVAAPHRHGIGGTVFEQPPQKEVFGTGIQLSCNRNHVLAELDVLDIPRSEGFGRCGG